MRKIPSLLAVIFSVSLTGCDKIYSPAAPSSVGSGSDSGVVQSGQASDVLKNWSPYVVVHTPGGVIPGYKAAFEKMTLRQTLKGIRMGVDSSGDARPVYDLASSYGLEILGIVGTEYFMSDDPEAVFDQIVRQYPGVSVFQIGNEVTGGPMVKPYPITIEQYIERFMRIYNHVRQRYPGLKIASQSTAGCYDAVSDMEKMINLGLGNTDPDTVIVTVNIYGTGSAIEYRPLIDKLRRHRVWVTESGVNNSDEHIGYVLTAYPEIRNILRPERIYWYALWVGDEGGDWLFGLIRNPLTPDIWMSPLFKVLTGAS